jgi:hypothetical protein
MAVKFYLVSKSSSQSPRPRPIRIPTITAIYILNACFILGFPFLVGYLFSQSSIYAFEPFRVFAISTELPDR